MTSKEKIKFVKKEILEKEKISPSGPIRIDLYNVIDIESNGGIPDDAPVLFSTAEQQLILRKLEEDGYLEKLWEINNASFWVERKNKESSPPVVIKKGKNKLEINENTGQIKLNKFTNKLNPKSNEFKVLIKLVKSTDHKATYEELLGNNLTKTNKRSLTFTIRNIKQCLGVLPQKKGSNPDIIKNIKNHGYILNL